MKSVLIVCEAGKGSGLGHFYRSVALAQIISDDYKVTLLSNNPDLPRIGFTLLGKDQFEDFKNYNKYDLIILDGYVFSSELIETIKNEEIPFVEISDFKEQLYPAKFWINTSMKSELPGKGLDFSLLRKEILEVARMKTFEVRKLHSVFIAFGGTDELSNSLKIVEALHDIHYFSKIGVLYPENGKDLNALRDYAESGLDIEVNIYNNLSVNELIQVSDQYAVALTSSSTVACEMIALRKVVYTCCLYENQKLLHHQLTNSKAAFHFDLSEILDQPDLVESFVSELIHPKFDQQELFDTQKKLIDGFAEERIRKFIANCFE